MPYPLNVGINSNTKAKAQLLLKERHVLDERSFAEIVVWQVPEPVAGSAYQLKYRLAYVRDRQCVLCYDNERGKGDHRHDEHGEFSYTFRSAEHLITDFWHDIENRRSLT